MSRGDHPTTSTALEPDNGRLPRRARGVWLLGAVASLAILSAGCLGPQTHLSNLETPARPPTPLPSSDFTEPGRTSARFPVRLPGRSSANSTLPVRPTVANLDVASANSAATVIPTEFATGRISQASATSSASHRLARISDLSQLEEHQYRRVGLADSLRQALQSNAIVRDDRQFLSPGNSLLANPEHLPSAFDGMIQQTGAGGVEAAESAFDVQAATGAQWGQNSLVQGNGFSSSTTSQSDILVSDAGSIYARLDKPMTSGGTFSLVHNWNYTINSLPSLSVAPRYAGFLRGEFRQPLLAGAGGEFTSVSGPLGYRNRIPGRGVTVARLDQSLSEAEFESRLHTLVKQTEQLYWDLWLAYRRYQTQVEARDGAKELWDHIRGRAGAGLPGGEAADEAQAQENYFRRKDSAETALADAFDAERRLRRLVGLPAVDGRLLWPTDPPAVEEVTFDWEPSLAEALARRIELRQQNLRIEGLELQAGSANNLIRPQLDFVSGVQLNGEGDSIYSGGSGSGYDALFNADEMGWNAGFEFSLPFGFRLEKARVRNFELRLSKAHAIQRMMESEVSLELDAAIRDVERWYASVQSNTKRYEAARRQFKAIQADYTAGRGSVDRLVRAQVTRAEAQLSRLRSQAEYSKAITNVLFRQGVLLDRNNIAMAGRAYPARRLRH